MHEHDFGSIVFVMMPSWDKTAKKALNQKCVGESWILADYMDYLTDTGLIVRTYDMD